jgi:predicted ATP-binding protein involved in virulence
MLITDIHRDVFQTLLEKHKQDSNFRFTLRGSNINDRLSKGYWFSGNDYSIYFSFWGGSDTINKTPNIYFVINVDGITHLNFVAKDSDKKAAFFEKLALLLDLKRTKHQGNYVNHWRKYYSAEPSEDSDTFKQNLEEFLTKDKPKIDLFIQMENNTELIPAINEYFFTKNVEQIEKFRSDTPTTEDGRPIESVQNKPIHLHELTINNIGHFENLSLPLNHRLTCLIGENGIGKTTLLRAIALGLCGISDSGWLDKKDDRLQKLLRITNEYNGRCVFAQQGSIDLSYQMDTDYTNTVVLRDDVRVDKYGISKSFINLFNANGVALPSTDQGNFFRNTLVMGFTQTKGKLPLHDNRPIHFSRRSREHDAFKRSNVSDVSALLYDMPDYRFEHFVDWMAHFLDQSRSTPTEVLKARRLLEKTILPFLSEVSGQNFVFRHINFDTREIFVTTNQSPNGVPLHALGQGICGIMGWLGYFVKRLWETNSILSDCTQAHAILLIDEIDTHLHPKWQNRLLDALLNYFPNTQFVVTTNSAVAVTHTQNKNNVMGVYEITQHGVQELRASGQHIGTFLLNAFGVSDRAEFAQNLIDNLFLSMNEDDLDMDILRNKLQELRDLLGEDDPDVVYAGDKVENLFAEV